LNVHCNYSFLTLPLSSSGTGKKISLELGGKSPVVVFEDADLDSVVEGVVNAIWFNQGQVCSAGSRLLVQEGVYAKLLKKIKARMATLRVGPSLDKCMDMGPLVDQRQYDDVMHHITRAREEGAVVYQAIAPEDLPRRSDGSQGLWVRILFLCTCQCRGSSTYLYFTIYLLFSLSITDTTNAYNKY
jgi:acyl-CoA reductase-like NAD-dependent aldehyde dehydrogenase